MTIIKYSLIRLGPNDWDWYKQRGYIGTQTFTHPVDIPENNIVAGTTYEMEVINTACSYGVINLLTEGVPFHQVDVPPMNTGDWTEFGLWLSALETDRAFTFQELVDAYQVSNPQITFVTP
jgi:hypothetical protein